MFPYLKGLHLTSEHWRDDRDTEGWPDGHKKKRQKDQEIFDGFKDHLTMVAAFANLQEGSNITTQPKKVLPAPGFNLM
jgi:hypothetical protein